MHISPNSPILVLKLVKAEGRLHILLVPDMKHENMHWYSGICCGIGCLTKQVTQVTPSPPPFQNMYVIIICNLKL